MFLTKNPARYIELAMTGRLPARDNMWYGTTATTPEEPLFYGEYTALVGMGKIKSKYRNERDIDLPLL